MRIKKQKTNSAIFTRIVTAAVLLFFVFGSTAAQQSVDELKGDIDEKQQKLDQITAEIQELQGQINRTKQQAATLKNEIALYDLQIRQTEAQIAAVELEIQKLSSEILSTQITIQEKEEQVEKQKDFLAETLRLINEYDQVGPLELTLANETFSDLLDQAQYADNLQEQIQEALETVERLKAELEIKKAELEKQLITQQELGTQLSDTRASLEEQRGNKNVLLTRTRGQEKLYQSLLTEAAKKQEEVEREIFEIEVAIRQRLGDKTLPPIEGILRWPMSGILTQGYGNTGFTALGYSFHNGIDVAAPAGTKIYAAGNGVIHATGTGAAAYGNWVVIKHTISKDGEVYNIYTLYGHLKSLVVAAGQVIRGGDLVGYEGNTGNTTRLLYGPERGYHLHFTIFDGEGFGIRQGAYQDTYGAYQIPYGYTYNPLNFLK